MAGSANVAGDMAWTTSPTEPVSILADNQRPGSEMNPHGRVSSAVNMLLGQLGVKLPSATDPMAGKAPAKVVSEPVAPGTDLASKWSASATATARSLRFPNVPTSGRPPAEAATDVGGVRSLASLEVERTDPQTSTPMTSQGQVERDGSGVISAVSPEVDRSDPQASTTILSTGQAVAGVLEMEDWEMAPGRIEASDGSSSDIAFSQAFLAAKTTVRICPDVYFHVETLKPGKILRFEADNEKTRIVSVAAGKLCVQFDHDGVDFIIGTHGVWKVKPGAACAAQNRLYVDAVVHVCALTEGEY